MTKCSILPHSTSEIEGETAIVEVAKPAITQNQEAKIFPSKDTLVSISTQTNTKTQKSSPRIDSLSNTIEEIDTITKQLQDTLFVQDSIKSVPKTDSTYISKDTLLIQDSIASVPRTDSTYISQDTTTQDSVKPLFNNTINYAAADSIKFSITNKEMYLYKGGSIQYLSTELKADSIVLNMENNIAYASGIRDSAGVLHGKPKFKDGSQEFESFDLRYNFKTNKGVIKEIVTKQGEGYIQGKLTKRMSDSIYCVKEGWYTTCDDHDHPHFYIRMSKAKLIKDKKVISGFANLYIEDVPLPLAIPFGFFPMTKKGTSGVLLPTYGEERLRGFNLRDGGYYWFINDYIDLTATGTIFTNGSWALNLGSNYRKRYKYNGNFHFSMSRNHTGEKGTEDYQESQDWSLRWSHSQDPKANPYTTFSASVDMSSANNNYYNSGTNINEIANQRKQSSISWSKRWPDRPFSITASFNHNQNTRDSSISLSFPNINFRMSQIYPFRKKERVGTMKWYENIGFTYNAELKNTIQTKESELGNSFKHMARDWQNGFQHSIPLSTSINLIKNLSFSPSFSYKGVAYLSSIRKGDWVVDSTMANYGYNPIDTIYGLHYAHNYTASASLSYNPTIYGMYQFKPDAKVFALRHVIRPSLSVSFAPNLGIDPKNYWKTYLDKNGVEQKYSIFEGKIYGTPTGSERSKQTGSFNVSIDNNVEMKVRNDRDTTSSEEYKKISILESFQIASNYNFFADSMRWSTIQVSARTKVFNNKINLNVSGTLDPYAITANAVRINKYHGGIGRLTQVNASTGISFSSDDGKKKEEKNDRLNGHYDEYVDFEVPWSISFDYTFSYSKNYSANPTEGATKPNTTSNISQMVGINGSFSLTPKWKFSFNSGYDFQQKEITATNFNISRDLHCWEMTFSCIPFGTHQSYNFQINVRSSMLKDLKLMKKDSWYDRAF